MRRLIPIRQDRSLKRSPAISQTDQRRNAFAGFVAYLRFCQNTPMYLHTMANQLQLMQWIDERRVEMLAGGRMRWVPSEHDYWQAMRDCWDDLVKPR